MTVFTAFRTFLPMIDFTILALDGLYTTSFAATVDMFTLAAELAPRFNVAPPRWKVCSVIGGEIRTSAGFSVKAEELNPSADDKSIWVVPGLGLGRPNELKSRLEKTDAIQVIDALRKHTEFGGTIAASCSAVFLLQSAGLLRNRRATTSWWLAPELKRLEPSCTVEESRMVCVDGTVITGGAGMAQTKLILHLLRGLCGGDLTDAIGRILLVDASQAQAQFIAPEVFLSGDDLVSRLVKRIESSLPDLPSVGELAKEFCMSERTLARHIHKSTGKSTLVLMQGVKQRRARVLLESSRMSIEQIAAAVGYQDATALRRLMKRVSGATPSSFRQAVMCA